MNIHRNKRQSLRILLTIFFLTSFFMSGSISYANTSSGWYSFRSEYLGSRTVCPSGTAQMDVALKEYLSFSNINPAGTRIKLQVWNMQDLNNPYFVRENGWASNAVVSHPICYNPVTEGIRPVIEISPSSVYRPHEQELIVGSIGWSGDRNFYLRGYVHLVRRSQSNGDTVYTISPREQIVNTDPSYGVGVRALPTQYNNPSRVMSVSGLASSLLYVWRSTDANWRRYDFSSTGGANTTRVLPRQNLTQEGYYLWTVSHGLRSSVVLGGPSSGYWIDWVDSIYSGTTYPYTNFLLDRTPPTTSVTVTLGARLADGRQEVTLQNNVRDTLSGLQRTRLFASSPTLGEVQLLNHNFVVGEGLTGGSKNTHQVTATATLPPGQTYQFFARTTDVAGNTTQSGSVSITVPPAPTASITVNNCAIPVGASTCPVNVSWTSANTIAPRSMRQNNIQFSTAASNVTGVSRPLSYGNNVFTFHHNNGTQIAAATVSTSCVTGSIWEGATCVQEISLAAAPAIIRSGSSATLRWTNAPSNTVTCFISGPGLPTTVTTQGFHPAIITEVTTSTLRNTADYIMTCRNSGGQMVGVSNTLRVDVIPTVIEI
jgi:hypothetical protein